ncbi:MAG: alanine--tRNA ligase, partial [Acidobacteria bacterium]|nr:alanine--tRNA ligase [Acidobacteriota bacterium]
LLDRLGSLAGVRYRGSAEAADVSMRVVADHLRAMTFLIGDAVVPSNEWRGYVLRKIMRRAMRHGKRLGLKEPFLHGLVDVLVTGMSTAYPQLGTAQEYIVRMIHAEEERFESVLTSGLPRLEEVLERAAAGDRVVPGDEAFRLYDTFGVPLDFIEDLVGERRLTLDSDGFTRAMEGQREKARAQSAFGAAKVEGITFSDEAGETLEAVGDVFEGYGATRLRGVPVLALFDQTGAMVATLHEGQTGYVALARTPFYVEAGGQVSDAGRIVAEQGTATATVERLVRARPEWPRLHQVRVDAGVLQARDLVMAEVDLETRDATRRNHTATHLLHAALRQVLGSHVKQAGSLVAPDRLRFDFGHFAPVTREQIDEIERIVNEQIRRNTPVQTEVKATAEAIAAGAMALFGEKYGDQVRVVSVPGFSLELCGGTHCRQTGDIGFFALVQESGIAAGVRRIEAVTGAGAVDLYQGLRRGSNAVLAAMNVPPDQAVGAIERLQADVKRLARENRQLKISVETGRLGLIGSGGMVTPAPSVQAGGTVTSVESGANPVEVIVRRVDGLDKSGLRELADSLKGRHLRAVVVLAGETDGKVSIVVSVTKTMATQVHAGNLVKRIAPIVGGGGGGRPDLAEAGGKNPERIDELLTEAGKLLRQLLAG